MNYVQAQAGDDLLDDALARARARRALPSLFMRRRIRERAGISRSIIAASSGVTTAAVAKWEAGERVPRGEALRRYADVLDRLLRETPA